MANSTGKKGPTRGRVEVTYFQKPADRTRTLLETPVISRRDTPPERGRPRDTVRELPIPQAQPVTTAPPARKERRRTTDLELEIPAHAREEKAPAPGPDGIVRHGAKTLGRKQIAEMAQFGHHLFENGRVPEAKAVFEGLVELGVEDAFPHTMLGILFLSEGATDRALALFQAALALDPRDLAARVYRAEVQLGQGKVRTAVAELEALAAATPADSPFGERARKLLSEARTSGAVRRRKR
ncbi:MAG: tetratricopeptide repeat protein [Myxococcota bacterium]|nr:tetratricopeptide repeat protein [Myxococcota bacterium]